MEQRLKDIAKAIGQSAINAYNSRAVPFYTSESFAITKAVYDEIVICVQAKSNPWKLARSAAQAAIICHWRETRGHFSHLWLEGLERDVLFTRAQIAAHATLRKMIKTTNYNRRLASVYDM